MIAIDSNKQEALDADQKSIQPINFIGNLELDRYTKMFFLIKLQKKPFYLFL